MLLAQTMMDTFFTKLLMKYDEQVHDLLEAQDQSFKELSDLKNRGTKRPQSEASLPPQQTAAPKRPVTVPGRSRDPRQKPPAVQPLQPMPPRAPAVQHTSSPLRPQQLTATPIEPPMSRKGKGRAGGVGVGTPPVVESAATTPSTTPRRGKLTLMDHGATIHIRKDVDGAKVICRRTDGSTFVLGTPQEFDNAFWDPSLDIRIRYVDGEKYYYMSSHGFIARFSQVEPLIRKFFLTNSPANY